MFAAPDIVEVYGINRVFLVTRVCFYKRDEQHEQFSRLVNCQRCSISGQGQLSYYSIEGKDEPKARFSGYSLLVEINETKLRIDLYIRVTYLMFMECKKFQLTNQDKSFTRENYS